MNFTGVAIGLELITLTYIKFMDFGEMVIFLGEINLLAVLR